jgi:uncharacterized membrane protein
MESRIKLLRHPVHPMLIVLPLGLFSIAVLFDLFYLLTGDVQFAKVAYWSIAIGILGGLLAAVFGVVDWLRLPKETRARSVGAWHGLGDGVIVVLFVASWLLRPADGAYAPDVLPFVLGLAGVGLALVTGSAVSSSTGSGSPWIATPASTHRTRWPARFSSARPTRTNVVLPERPPERTGARQRQPASSAIRPIRNVRSGSLVVRAAARS